MLRFLVIPTRQLIITRNQACASFVRKVRPRPLDQHDQPVTEADEKENVDEKPGQPGDEARNMKFPKVSDGGSASDGGETAFVHVVKVLAGFTCQVTLNVFGRCCSFLYGYRRDSGKHFAVFIFQSSQVADDKNFRMPSNTQVGIHQHSAGAIDWNAQLFSQRRCCHAGGPQNNGRWKTSFAHPDCSWLHSGNHGGGLDFHSKTL